MDVQPLEPRPRSKRIRESASICSTSEESRNVDHRILFTRNTRDDGTGLLDPGATSRNPAFEKDFQYGLQSKSSEGLGGGSSSATNRMDRMIWIVTPPQRYRPGLVYVWESKAQSLAI